MCLPGILTKLCRGVGRDSHVAELWMLWYSGGSPSAPTIVLLGLTKN